MDGGDRRNRKVGGVEDEQLRGVGVQVADDGEEVAGVLVGGVPGLDEHGLAGELAVPDGEDLTPSAIDCCRWRVPIGRGPCGSPALLPLVEQMATWARQDPAVADWVAQYVKATDGMHRAGEALTGAVMAWTRVHGVVSLEVEGQLNGMGHQPSTLLEVEMHTLADTFHLDRPHARGPGCSEAVRPARCAGGGGRLGGR